MRPGHKVRPSDFLQGGESVILSVPSLDAFVREARDGGAVVVWVCRKIEARSNGGPRFWRAKFTATALGLIGAFAVGSGDASGISLEKTLIRYEKDFGWVLEDFKAGAPPEDYQERVVRAEQEICSRLEAEGFQVRQGEIEAV